MSISNNKGCNKWIKSFTIKWKGYRWMGHQFSRINLFVEIKSCFRSGTCNTLLSANLWVEVLSRRTRVSDRYTFVVSNINLLRISVGFRTLKIYIWISNVWAFSSIKKPYRSIRKCTNMKSSLRILGSIA